MSKSAGIWDTILKVVIAVASAVLGFKTTQTNMMLH